MHEISLIESVIEAVTAEMPVHNMTKLETITLRIGKMRQVIPDTLLFAFDVLTKDTLLAGAELIIKSVSSKGRCRICGQEFIIENWPGDCPKCAGTDIEIISGKELEIIEFAGS